MRRERKFDYSILQPWEGLTVSKISLGSDGLLT